MTDTSIRESKTVLITGASSGIGEATARHLASLGHQVMLGARRTDRLAALVQDINEAGGQADFRQLDVSVLEEMQAFAGAAHERFGRIDVLVNNAGVMPLSPLSMRRVEEWDRMIDVNLRGTLHGIAAVLPYMEERRSGQIVNIASSSAHRVDPTAAVYCATKFAVRALSEGLRQESEDLRVTVISPGFTSSELMGQGGAPEVMTEVRTAADQLAIPASAVAQAIAYAVDQPAHVDVNEVIVRPTAQR
ncbi:SDR family oxidoreductase [Streptomyces lunalinharesii]|uniref:SDR family oxidoreductase n=1 Tax=Streptomyces lunalinharesii TaxID=333384 RepID=A0ABP6EHS1_9ACTN